MKIFLEIILCILLITDIIIRSTEIVDDTEGSEK